MLLGVLGAAGGCVSSKRVVALEARVVALEASLADRELELEATRIRQVATLSELDRAQQRLSVLEEGSALDRARVDELTTMLSAERARAAGYRLTTNRWRTWLDDRVAVVERRSGIPRPPVPGAAIVEDEGAAAIAADAARIRALLAAKDSAGARQFAEQSLVLHGDHPGSAELRFLHAEALVAEKRWNPAIEALHFLLEAHGDTRWAPAARVHLAACLVEVGDRASALVVLEDVLRLHAGSPEAKVASGRLESLRSVR